MSAYPDGLELSFALEELPEIRVATHAPRVGPGVPAIDVVIEAAIVADTAALMAHSAFGDIACAESTTDAGPFLCPDGVPAGTSFPVLNFVSCHGNPSTMEQAEEQFDLWARDEIALYAVYEADTRTNILLTRNGAAFVVALTVDGLIAYIDAGCGPRPPELLVADVTDFILAPVTED